MGSIGDSVKKGQTGKKRAQWTEAMEQYLIDYLASPKAETAKTASGNHNWKQLEDKMEKEFGHIVDNVQIKTKYEQLRKEYNSIKDLLFRQTGLGWDDGTQTITADDSWWDSPQVVRIYI